MISNFSLTIQSLNRHLKIQNPKLRKMPLDPKSNRPPASPASLPVELHSHILSFLPFDTLFVASKALPLWQTLFTTHFFSTTQYTPPIPTTSRARTNSSTTSDFIYLAQHGVIHETYLHYDTGFKLDITNDPILTTPFFEFAEVRDISLYIRDLHPTRWRRTQEKPNSYVLPKVKCLGYQQISPAISI